MIRANTAHDLESRPSRKAVLCFQQSSRAELFVVTDFEGELKIGES